MKYTIAVIALVGYTNAQCFPCGAPCETPLLECPAVAPCQLSGAQAALRPGNYDNQGGFAKLSAESAASQTQIGAQNIIIPDKNTVTDQAKVSECCSKGEKAEQNCEVARRVFDIAGSICVTEKYNDQAKGQHVASKSGEGASQTRSRTQVENNTSAIGEGDIPCTCSCGKCY